VRRYAGQVVSCPRGVVPDERIGILAHLGLGRAADKFTKLDRVLAALYAARWQQVVAEWPQVDVGFRSRFGLLAARASVEMANWGEAERYLQSVPIRQRIWDNPLSIANSDFRDRTLSEFYLTKLFEHAGKKMDAINAYQEFLSHFENSNAHLPQIAQARSALKHLL
jgi:hypothetical protein